MAGHTPGPWEVADEHPDGVLDRSVMADGYYVATVHDTACDCWDADARLIAAAPDLLAALKDMREGWRYIREHHRYLYGVVWDRAEQAADAAIAKAEGAA